MADNMDPDLSLGDGKLPNGGETTEVNGGGEPTAVTTETPEEIALGFKNMGNTLTKEKKYDLAIEAYTKGIAACNNPDVRGPILGNRSHAYRRLGNYEKSLEDANTVVGENPMYARGHTRKAYVLREMKRWTECKDTIEAARKTGVVFQDKDEKNVKLLYKEASTEQVVEKLLGTWNGRVPEELGGGSQELEFKSSTNVILTVPGRQMPAKMVLDVTKDPMWLDITITGFEQPMPHIFKFNADFTELHLMGPPEQGPQAGVRLKRPTSIDTSSQAFVKMHRGKASASAEEKNIENVIQSLAGKPDEEKIIKYCELMYKKLGDAVQRDGFKFEEPQAHWPQEDIKKKIASMVKMSQYIFLLEKHFGEVMWQNIFAMVQNKVPLPAGRVKDAVDTLRRNMIAAGMSQANAAQPEKKQAPVKQPQAQTSGQTNFQNHQFSDNVTETKTVAKTNGTRVVTGDANKKEASGTSSWGLVLMGAAAAGAVIGLAYVFFGGSGNKNKK